MLKGKSESGNVIFNIVMTILLFAFLITGATFLVLSFRPLYYAMIKWFDIEKTSGYTTDVIKANYDAVISYNMFWGPETLRFPDFPMSTNAEIHFMEVKRIFVTMQYIFIGSGLLLIPGSIIAKKKGYTTWPKACAFFTIAAILIVGFGLVFFWDQTFVLFHKIMFNNDFWIFSYKTDPVILILPDEVFLVDAAAILALMAAGMTGFILGFGKKKKENG